MTGLLRRAARAVQPAMPRASSGVHVLAYHLVGAGVDSPVDLPVARFEAQMEELADGWEVVALGEALARPGDGRTAEGKPRLRVALTFDDAFLNFVTHALPILVRLGLPSTLYVPTGFVAGEIPGPLAGAERLRPIPWSGLRELGDAGVTLGSHGHSHLELPRVDRRRALADLRLSRELLLEHTGLDPEHFAYPRANGWRRDDRPVRDLFSSAAVAGGRLNAPGFDPWRLSRIPVRRDMPTALAPLLTRRLVLEERLASTGRAVRVRLSGFRSA